MNVQEKIHKVNSSPTLLALNRLVVPAAGTLATAFGALCVWLGLQIWDGQQHIANDVVEIKVQQAVTDTKLSEAIRRLDRIEDQRQGSLVLPAEPQP